MSTVVLRRWHGALVFTVPNAFVLEHNLVAGSAMRRVRAEHLGSQVGTPAADAG